MQWIEVSVPTRSDEIDDVCAQLAELGAGGMVVEDETDFQQFLEQNHQYWDYVDDALEAQFRGVSRIKFYLADDDDGIDHARAIQVAQLPNIIPNAHVRRMQLDKHQLTAAGAVFFEVYNVHDLFQLCQLLHDLLKHHMVALHDDRHAGNLRISRGRNGQ